MLNLRALWQALHTLAHPCRANDAAIERHVAAALGEDDLTAVAEAVGVMAEPTPLADAALDFLRTSLAALDAMETVDDFVWLTGGDA